MLLQSDIKISGYTAIPHKVSEKELQQKTLLLTLSIFQDEIECAIIDSASNSVISSSSYSSSQKKFSDNELLFLINDFIQRYHLQQLKYSTIQIIVSSPHSTLCPLEYYLPEQKEKLLKYVHPVSPNEIILTNDFENIKIIFSISQNLYHNLQQIFPSAKFYHSCTSMMHIFFYHPYLIHSKIWLHIHPNYIEVISKDNKQLLFYNSFEIKTTLDILYYTLFSVEQLGFTPAETDVFISGNLSTNHTIFQLLQKYLHSVQLVTHHPKLHILPADSLLLSHHHFITLNHYLCVSYQESVKEER